MSEFDEFVTENFGEFAEVVGTQPFILDGHIYQGVFEEKVLERRQLEEGGMVNVRSDRIIASRSQFLSEPALGSRVEVAGEHYRIARVASDVATFTLVLADTEH